MPQPSVSGSGLLCGLQQIPDSIHVVPAGHVILFAPTPQYAPSTAYPDGHLLSSSMCQVKEQYIVYVRRIHFL